MLCKHILLVEDDLDSRQIFLDTLKDIAPGCACDTANNGVEAIEYLHHNRPDLIITDLNMPKIDGLEFIKVIKKMLLSIPLVIWSTSSLDINLASTLGVNGAIEKPSNYNDLYSLIQRMVTCCGLS
ncbi:response regulator [Taibaiella soli]|uniref:Response regulator n=1 Tax=Taibaiella soli TaxID=1649169 RepID=A0A2W2A7J6_9BACT|nr:response regulator [Taibaiella soli]PZF71305.1 response regulator [Taibaiella soli]